jgi:hypothetical protein
MRRRILALAALAALLLSAIPAAAATSGNAFHFSATGKGAEAGWSTFPADGIPVVNVVYTDTFVFASEDAITQDGEVFSDKFAFIDQISFKIDRRGNFVFVSETFGFAGGSDVNLAVDSKLNSASLTASVALQTCTERSCTDAGIGSLVASWTGQGDIIRQSGTFHVTSKTFTESGQFRGSFRNATATGSLNGAGFGSQFFADIFSSTSRDVFICHGC